MGGLLLVHYRVAAFLGALIVVSASSPRQILEIKNNRGITANQADNNNFHNQHHNNHHHDPHGGLQPFVLLIGPVFQVSATIKPFADFSWNFLTSGMGEYTLGLAELGILWAIFKNRHSLELCTLDWITISQFLVRLVCQGQV